MGLIKYSGRHSTHAGSHKICQIEKTGENTPVLRGNSLRNKRGEYGLKYGVPEKEDSSRDIESDAVGFPKQID